MSDAKRALLWMGQWVLVIAFCDLLRVLEDIFINLPVRIADSLYLPVLSLLLIWYLGTRISERSGLKLCLMGVAWMMFLFILIRETKYVAFDENNWILRQLWYLYYVPCLLMALFSCYAAQLINEREKKYLPDHWQWKLAVTVFFLALILTNDLHQQVFGFQPGFVNWNDDYSHNWGYWSITLWQYGLFAAALVTMVRKCRVMNLRKLVWIPLLTFMVGTPLLVLYLFGIQVMVFRGHHLLGFPEIICFTVALFWEACIQIGLVPTNESYGKMLKRTALPVWITSEDGSVIYSSETAETMPEEIRGVEGEIMPNPDTVIHSRRIPGGFGVWKEDIFKINRVNSHLKEIRKQLREEEVLLRLENERKEAEARVRQQNALYDSIAEQTKGQTGIIYLLAKEAEQSEDPALKKKNAALIGFYGAYIKRISNLTLLNLGSTRPGTGELGLAVGESLRYLDHTGIRCTFGGSADRPCPPERLIAAYRIFEALLEERLPALQGVYAAMREEKDGVTLRLTLEGSEQLPSAGLVQLAEQSGLSLRAEAEDGSLYIRLQLTKEGEAP